MTENEHKEKSGCCFGEKGWYRVYLYAFDLSRNCVFLDTWMDFKSAITVKSLFITTVRKWDEGS